ncbi:MAG: AAA family ATPase [Cyanobacteria bacterium SZAS LIN-3]|nr:AAA family ATPase [Cyanobacteria bacterium SZAS LIN-3]
MLSKLFKYLKKLPKDRVFRKSVLHFMAFFAVVAAFTVLTTNHIITRKPQPVLPAEYAVLAGSDATIMSQVTLEQTLRSDNFSEIQGLIFFKGINHIVVMGNGLEHDKVVPNADVDEMRKLAVADKLIIVDKTAGVQSQIQDLLPGWWWVVAITLACWLVRMLVFKREKGQVYSRLRVFCSAIPDVMDEIIKATKLKPSRFYLYLLAALVIGNGAAFGLRLYHDEHMYVLPDNVAHATRIQPWQISRHLDTHPEEFQRVSLVPELNTAYIMLNSRSVPVVKDKHDYSDDEDTTAVDLPIPAATASGNVPVSPRGGVAPAPVAKPPVYVGNHKPILVERTVEFGAGPEGKAEFQAFSARINEKKVESKVVDAKHETGYIESLTVQGRIIMGTILGITVLLGMFVMMVWSDWKDKEKPRAPGEVYNPRLVGAGGVGGGGGTPIVTREEDRKTFADVAGCQEAIDELIVVKKKIMRPRLYKVFGAPVPSGVILYGPPGTGKTLLARALAGEVGGSFQALSGSEFVEMYVGVGAKRVREAYAKARADARKTGRISIVFIDEFDALAKKRGNSTEGGNREYEQTLNQLLVEMNGFGNHGLVLTMAATNRLDILDEAVLRPGRFDIKVKVPKPDRKGRALIYGIYLKKLKLVVEGEGDALKANYDQLLDDLARRSHDFSGAEIEGSIKDGATIAVERQFGDVLEDITPEQEEEYRTRAIITPNDLHLGIDKMAYGTQIRSRVRTDKERKATAIHEIGHAAIPTILNGDKVNRITIVMTDKSLGLMDSSPEEGERYDWTDEQFIIRLKMMLAGRAAEKVLLKKISTGASNDFERASALARQMVGVYGMSEAFGNKSIPLDQHGFPASNIGETMLQKFNDAWGKLIDDMQAETERLIEEHKSQIEYCAQHLYEDETLTGDEFRRLWAEKAQMDKDAATAAPTTTTEGDTDAQQ